MTNKLEEIKEKFGLTSEEVDKIITAMLENHKIQKIILFGSRAKGEFKKGSDIDISVIADNLSLNELNQIKVDVNELNLPYKIDIVNYNKIENKELKEHIDRVGKRLYP